MIYIIIDVFLILLFTTFALTLLFHFYIKYREYKLYEMTANLMDVVTNNCSNFMNNGINSREIDEYRIKSRNIIYKYRTKEIIFSIKPIYTKFWYTKEELDYIYHGTKICL